MPYPSVAFVYAAGDRDGLGDVLPAAVLVGRADGASLGDGAGVGDVSAGEAQLVSDASRRTERRTAPWTHIFVPASVSQEGFEPTTKGLRVPCSTAELLAHSNVNDQQPS
jgi:hypothetical protein